jgi:hypothetical protein
MSMGRAFDQFLAFLNEQDDSQDMGTEDDDAVALADKPNEGVELREVVDDNTNGQRTPMIVTDCCRTALLRLPMTRFPPGKP